MAIFNLISRPQAQGIFGIGIGIWLDRLASALFQSPSFSAKRFYATSPTTRPMGRVTSILVCGLALVIAVSPVVGQDVDEPPLQAGLKLTLTAADATQLHQTGTQPRLIADLQSIDPRLPSGPFNATWNGKLQSKADGEYRFFAHSDGAVRVALNGKTILDQTSASGQLTWFESRPVTMEYGLHAFVVEYRDTRQSNDSSDRFLDRSFGRLSLFWSGPGFQLEPLPTKQLFSEKPLAAEDDRELHRGAELYHALRCAACHELPGTQTMMRAPALGHLHDYLERDWLVAWLSQHGDNGQAAIALERRMPVFDLPAREVESLVDYLLAEHVPNAAPTATRSSEQGASVGGASAVEGMPVPMPARPRGADEHAVGQRLFHRVGCLACHTDEVDGQVVGQADLFGGGDLSAVGSKRTAQFFRDWLIGPERVNVDHRMPVFALTVEERALIGDYLSTKKAAANRTPLANESIKERAASDRTAHVEPGGRTQHGRLLFAKWQCDRCHRGPEANASDPLPQRRPLAQVARWDESCLAAVSRTRSDPLRPQYQLSQRDRAALQHFVRTMGALVSPIGSIGGRIMLTELGCLNCHRREEAGASNGFLSRVVSRASPASESLAKDLDRLRPPSLDGVGDKLHRHVLVDTLRGKVGQQRSWLNVRMPSYAHLSTDQATRLVDYLIAVDRIPHAAADPLGPRPLDSNQTGFASAKKLTTPDNPRGQASTVSNAERLAGARLVTSNGFGCLSCHAIGSVEPKEAAPGTRGPNLRAIASRVRQTWFDRFVRNPARIIPQLEMPSMQIGVSGVLGGDLSLQLSAIWKVLDDPNFEPPLPDPVRTLRFSGVADSNEQQRAIVVTDVVRSQQETFEKPFYLGFPNRHAILYDLNRGAVARWSVGDLANQQTDKKAWYWQATGMPILESPSTLPEVQLTSSSGHWQAVAQGQFLTSADHWHHSPDGVILDHRLLFSMSPPSTATVGVNQLWQVADTETKTGILRRIRFANLPPNATVRFQVVPTDLLRDELWVRTSKGFASADGLTTIDTEFETSDSGLSHGRMDSMGCLLLKSTQPLGSAAASAELTLRYQTATQIDRFAKVATPETVLPLAQLDVVPGFLARRCPLPQSIMPISLTWQTARKTAPTDANFVLYFGSLKGRVWRTRDTDGDSLEDAAWPFSDELASPYGLASEHDYVDVLTKHALLRLKDEDGDDFAEDVSTVAAGWGHTADYHDWAVGLPRDAQGRYFVALPCQQDERSATAAKWRGHVLMLVPREPSVENPYAYDIVDFASGQRFPMGLALNRAGQLFATDNQGNYNPFNELNYIQRGRHYGFINRLERKPGYQPTLTRAAIQIPHPWTRSVNGICFLEHPNRDLVAPATESARHPGFGPFEGHLIGCEYDTRRLIRMTLQDVEGTVQGAAYPFSRSRDSHAINMLGPVAIAVSPEGAIYVGSLRDSGWGGSNNVGELIRLDTDFERLPCGLREVTATRHGMRLEFTRPVDRVLAGDPTNYSVQSAFRVSTPIYGGDDQDRKTHHVTESLVSDDGRTVHLGISALAVGRVYEIRIQRLIARETDEFFPAEAYLTVMQLPQP